MWQPVSIMLQFSIKASCTAIFIKLEWILTPRGKKNRSERESKAFCVQFVQWLCYGLKPLDSYRIR